MMQALWMFACWIARGLMGSAEPRPAYIDAASLYCNTLLEVNMMLAKQQKLSGACLSWYIARLVGFHLSIAR